MSTRSPTDLRAGLGRVPGRRGHPPQLLKTLATGAVEQHHIPFGIPDGREPDTPGAVQTEVDTARSGVPRQHLFRHGKDPDLEFLVGTEGLVDELL